MLRNLSRIPGNKKYPNGGATVTVCCPHPEHNDSNPSCVLNIVDTERYKAGMAKCWSCGRFMHWNQIAEWLGLEKIAEDSRAEIYVTRPDFNSNEDAILGDEGDEESESRKFDQICASLRVPLHLPWHDQKWRGIRAKTLRKMGAHYGLDEEEEGQAVVLPVYVQGQLEGAIKGRWQKKKKQLSYVNSKGPWSSTRGLFLIDQAVKKGRTAIMCEGPRDGLRLLQDGLPGVSTLGAKSWSKGKRDLLLSCGIENLIFCYDQDKAGDEALELVSADCFGYFQCKNFSLRKWGKRLGLEGLDPGNMPEQLINKLHNMWSKLEGWDE